MIYSHWLLLVFNLEFLGWTLVLLVFIALSTAAFILVGSVFFWLAPVAIAVAILMYAIRFSRQFLVRMIVDYDANNGDGRVIIQRLIPSPTLPETVQFPLQQAAEGSPEVNTKGIVNTIITQVKALKFLRPFTIGDLTLRGPAAPFGITMYNIMDPGGVKSQLEKDWKKIAAIKAKAKAEADRKEDIERMRIAVTEGIIEGIKKARELNMEIVPQVTVNVPPQVLPAPMDWTPVSELRGEEEEDEEGEGEEAIAPTESTGIGEEPEPPAEEAPSALSPR